MTKHIYIGIDVGGSKIEGILWQNGKISSWQKVKTPRTKKEFVGALFDIIGVVKADRKIQGIGMSLAGAIDQRTGVVVSSPNLRFLAGLNLQKIVAKKFGVPVRLQNDAQCFLLGEVRFGQARGKTNVLGMIIGTGLGGAIYMNGQLLSGAHGFAGEQGMATLCITPSLLQREGRLPATLSLARRAGGEYFTVEDLISSHGFRRLGVAKPLDYQNRAFSGDKKAIGVYNSIGKFLGIHLANLTEIFNPELIIIGGGIARARYLLLRPALAEMRKHLVFPKKYWPAIRTSKLKNAGLLGAVSLFFSSPGLGRVAGRPREVANYPISKNNKKAPN